MPFLNMGSKRFSARVDDSLMVSYGSPEAASERVPFDEVARRTCSNLDCTSAWTAPWRNRKRPVFEGRWACSGRCMVAIVAAALRREAADARTMAPAGHRHRIPLGLVMLAQGWITQTQLQAALQAQRASGRGRIGDWLMSECGLEPEQVTRGLSVQWNCPVLPVQGFSPREMALVMPGRFVEEFGLLPLRVAGGRLLYLGCEDRLNASVAYAVEQMSGLKVESGLVEAAQFRAARTSLLVAADIPVVEKAVEDQDALAAQITAVLEQWQPVASRLVRLHHYYWLRLLLESGTKGEAGLLPRSAEDVVDCIFTTAVR
jgi:Type II secretion system (T2SS), protein E, N-terminal domain